MGQWVNRNGIGLLMIYSESPQEVLLHVVLDSIGKLYLYFLSFLNNEMVQVLEILPHWKKDACSFCMVGTIAADSLAKHGTRVSVPLDLPQTSIIRCNKSPNLNVSHLVLHLSLPVPNPLNPGVKLRMKMQLEQRWQAMIQLHLSDQQFYCLTKVPLIIEVWQ